MSDFDKAIEAFRTLGLRAPAYFGRVLWRRRDARRTARAIADAPDLQTKFSLIHAARWWDRQGESVSGPGSTMQFTESFRRDLEELLRQRQVSNLLDAPCGDWNWFSQVKLPENLRYTGADIVPDLVEQLQKKYRSDNIKFRVLDITKDVFPEADLWLCRDCLAHLSNVNVRLALERFCASTIPYALISNYIIQARNTDIDSGDFRPLDLTKPPFSLPPPELAINDWPGEQGIRQVGLWKRDEIAKALATPLAPPLAAP